MKKIAFRFVGILAYIVLLLALILALVNNHNVPITITNEVTRSNILAVKIKNHVYLPLEELNNILNNELTYKGKENTVEIGTNISENSAIMIANAVIEQFASREYVEKSLVRVDFNNEDNCNNVYRYIDDCNGGAYLVIIDKENGKVVRVSVDD